MMFSCPENKVHTRSDLYNGGKASKPYKKT